MEGAIKILFLSNEYPPYHSGGIATFTCSLAESLAALGVDVTVIGLYNHSDQDQFSVVNGVKLVFLSAEKGWGAPLKNRVRLYQAIQRIAEEGAIDVIEAPDFEGVSAFLPRQSRLRVVRLHGSHVYFADERQLKPSRSIKWFEKTAMMQADAILSVSAYTARRTQALFCLKNDIQVIYNAVRLPEPSHIKTDYAPLKQVLYFGTLAEKKGVFSLAKAWREFHRRLPDWRLTLIGKDSLYQGVSVLASLKQLLAEAGDSVEYLGPLPQQAILAQFQHYDFVVLPSFSEAFALAPIEAMSCAMPVIFSSLSSGPELIQDGENGWLCDPGQPDTILECLLQAAENQPLRMAIGLAAREKVLTDFNYERFIQENLAFYENSIA